MRGIKLALMKYFPAYSLEVEYEKRALKKRGTSVQRREGNTAASRSFDVSQLSAESSGYSCTSI